MLKVVALLALAMVASVHSQLNPSNCGTRPLIGKRAADADDDGKIVGGSVAVAGDWGWQIALRTNGRFFCGGSVITTLYCITAAHCTAGQNVATLSVLVGAHTVGSPESYSVTRSVSAFYQHASYSSSTMQNDISALRMASAVTYTNYIIPVCLLNNVNYEGSTGWATGWGTTSSGGATAPTLRQVDLLIRTQAQCTSGTGSYPASQINQATMVCAGVYGDNKDTCQGDSGGPLVVSVGGKWYLQGITSWGVGCGNIGVYARAPYYYSWIQTQVNRG
jgi:secreted trypsin-like serine protease